MLLLVYEIDIVRKMVRLHCANGGFFRYRSSSNSDAAPSKNVLRMCMRVGSRLHFMSRGGRYDVAGCTGSA